ncbi:hemolysin family protein [Natronorubrum thiooxidans]|uniref:Hemolysin, contains CBS domains n=1 Tax=Natronorubrum thiooxidans TaxID=308853 RepID=A0A1N7EJQ0_9EURY|nr:hemolysin family protein [Natronorubrum thiooxidans]SIR88352.1 Hemolysin, contains CBS domains [Natronorubrum thiooxidans]
MVDLAFSLGRLVFALFLVFLNGFFVASEFAYVRIRSTQIETLVKEGRSSAKLVQEAEENLDDYLATTQLGITIASLGLGWVGEPAIASLLEPVLGSVLPAGSIHLVAIAIGFSVITFLHVVFGELAPKTLAIADAERIALLVAAPMKFFYYLFLPGIIVFNGTANFFTRLIGVAPASERDESHSQEEIIRIVSQSGKQGAVDMDEVEMIKAVFDLSDTVAREVMVPRPDVVTVRADTPLSELRRIAASGSYSRFPVVDEDADQPVIGFVHARDVLQAIETANGDGRSSDADQREEPTARELARDALIVPETRRIDEILAEFRRQNVHLAVVIDEWGAFEGVLTIEDVIEEVIGEIRDEFDVASTEPSIDERSDGRYVMDGGVLLADVNEILGTSFESDAFETIGGLVLSRLGRPPDVGDALEVDGYELTVEDVDGTRVSEVAAREAGAGVSTN